MCFATEIAINDPVFNELNKIPNELDKNKKYWINFQIDEIDQLKQFFAKFLGFKPYNEHIADCINSEHQSNYDSTEKYNFITIPNISLDESLTITKTIVGFFVTENFLITVNSNECKNFIAFWNVIQSRQIISDMLPVDLGLAFIDKFIDKYLKMKSFIIRNVSYWESRLIDQFDNSTDYKDVLILRKNLRKLISEMQDVKNAIADWKENTDLNLKDKTRVKFSDVDDHADRVADLFNDQENNLDSIIQLHLAVSANFTTQVMQVLTIVTIIFLPLSLIAGIFGMNFHYMPELKATYGFYYSLFVMLLIAIILILIFRKKRWV